MRSLHGVAARRTLSPAVAGALTPSSLSHLTFASLMSTEPDAKEEYIMVKWSPRTSNFVTRHVSDSTADALYAFMPDYSLLLDVDGVVPSAISSGRRKDKLFEALKAGKGVLVSEAYTTHDAASCAVGAAHPVLLAGVPAPRTPSGKVRRIARLFKVPFAQRQCRHGQPLPPPILRAGGPIKSQGLRLYLYSARVQLSTPAGGARGIVASHASGTEQLRSWLSKKAAEAEAAREEAKWA